MNGGRGERRGGKGESKVVGKGGVGWGADARTG